MLLRWIIFRPQCHKRTINACIVCCWTLQ